MKQKTDEMIISAKIVKFCYNFNDNCKYKLILLLYKIIRYYIIVGLKCCMFDSHIVAICG